MKKGLREKLESKKVLRVIKDKDDVVSGAELQVFNHKTGRGIISRSIQKLFPLEISSKEINAVKNDNNSPMVVFSKEEPRVPLVLDFPATDLGEGEVEARTMGRQSTAVDVEIRWTLVQMYEGDNDDELGWLVNSVVQGRRVLNFCYQVDMPISFVIKEHANILAVMVAVAIVIKRWTEIN